jgi:hypothetical protein
VKRLLIPAVCFLVAGGACRSPGGAARPPARSVSCERGLQASDLMSAVVDLYQPLPGETRRRLHHLSLTREQLLEFVPLFESASLVEEPRQWFITATVGRLETSRGTYEFQCGPEKIGRRTHRCSLEPVGAPEGRASIHYRWTRDQGRVVASAVNSMLASNADQAVPVKAGWSQW